MGNDKLRYCAACGKDMLDPKTGTRTVALEIDIRNYIEAESPEEAINKAMVQAENNAEFLKKQLGPYAAFYDPQEPSIAICWECVLRSLGIKPRNSLKPSPFPSPSSL